MNLFFILNSPLIKSGSEDNEAVQLAVKTGALIEGDDELRISEINERLLLLIIKHHSKDLGIEDEETPVPPLEGGLRIEFQGGFIHPQCCSEIDDYLNWTEMMLQSSPSWKELWIGHPCIYYRMEDDRLYLSDYYEPGGPPEEVDIKFVFNKDQFFTRLDACLTEIEVFKQKIKKVVHEGNFKNKEGLIQGLVD